MHRSSLRIGSRVVGDGHPVLLVAEMSGNHLQDFSLALRTLKEMKKAGADAVKLQTYTPDTLTIDCRNRYFRIKQRTLWDGMTLYELYKKAYTPWEWQPKLKRAAADLGLIFFSTPFDRGSVDFLERIGVPAYKVASFEIGDIPLIEYIASRGKPVILSTGIAGLPEIKAAVAACRGQDNDRIVLLKCTSAYPAPIAQTNLRTIPDMEKRFSAVVGLSDHTQGDSAAIASIALGARIVEKHFILDRRMGGPDAVFSLEPDEFRRMGVAIRAVEAALGRVSYDLSPQVKRNRIFCRSLFVTRDIACGERFSRENVRSIRPGYGLSPVSFKRIDGKRAVRSIKKGTPLTWDLVSKK